MTAKHRCEPCNKEFLSKQNLNGHLAFSSAHIKSEKVECDLCHSMHLNKRNLRSHMRRVHQNLKGKRRNCNLCEKTYCDSKGLKQHLVSVHGQGEKSHKCEYCGHSFVFVTQVRTHIRRVHHK